MSTANTISVVAYRETVEANIAWRIGLSRVNTDDSTQPYFSSGESRAKVYRENDIV